MKRNFVFGLIALLLLTGFVWAENTEDLPYKQGEIIVQFKNTGPDAPIRKFLSGPLSSRTVKGIVANTVMKGSVVKQELENIKQGLSLIKLPAGKTVQDALLDFGISSEVAFVQPNFRYKLLATYPGDAFFGSEWGLHNTGQTSGNIDADIDAPEAWDFETGDANIVVAVTDMGIYYEHPDLLDNMWTDPCDPCAETIKYGYDPAGADWEDQTDADTDPVPGDEQTHGTHVAGTIGAVGDNGIGITGVCWDVSLMSIKIFADNSEGAYSADIISGISWAVAKGANVINASWGGGGFDSLVRGVIANAGDNGIVFVAAAGNDSSNNDAGDFYPSGYDLDNIISVMATNHYDNIAYYSNYGLESVDIAAPGGETLYSSAEGIVSTVPDEGYAWYQGTSMAAPHVAGAIALMLSADPTLTPAQIKTILLHPLVCDRLPTLEGFCVSEGRLNLFNAIRVAKSINPDPDRVLLVGGGTYPYIQDAIDAAGDDDAIIADSNNWYFEKINFNGKDITVTSSDITNPNDTFISDIFTADPCDTHAVVTFENSEPTTALLKGFTICDGIYSGIDVNGATPTIENCTISKNTNADGGGVILENGADALFESCTIAENIASGNGGGIYCTNSLPDINGCTITDNNAVLGGGIYSDATSEPNITNTLINENISSEDGGGLYLAGSTPLLESCTIADNNSTDDGGGIYIAGTATPDINNTPISQNIAGGKGGGLYLESTTGLTITDSPINSNTSALSGGGIYCKTTNITLAGLTISSNSSQWDGGGIYFDSVAPDVNGCIFTSNYTLFWGGAICYSDVSDANLFDSEFGNNTALDSAGAVYLDYSPIDVKNCLFYNNAATTYDGGAMVCYQSSADITNCTFAGNTSNSQNGKGGAICVDGNSDPTILNCIFSENNVTAIYEYGTTADPTVNYNLFYNNIPADYYDKDTSALYDANDVNDAYPDMNGLAEIADTLYGDPIFVPGRLGNYYLSHDMNDPNLQPYTGHSPAIDAGSDTAANLTLDTHHTRTDNVNDVDVVDLGYHYNDPLAAQDYTITLIFVPTEASSGTTVTADPNQADVKPGITRKQYAQVILTVTPDSDYDLTAWNGTDNDANLGYNEGVGTYTNLVTMNDDKGITLTFSLAMIDFRFLLWPGTNVDDVNVMIPQTRHYSRRRGTKVELYVEQTNPSHAVIWHDTDDDSLITRENTKTLLDLDGDGMEVAYIEIYSPETFYVGSDMDYPTIQLTINDAHDRDIVEMAPGTYQIYEASEDSPVLEVNGKAITIRSQDPTDPCVVAATKIIGGFIIGDVGRNMVLDGLTIEANYSSGNGCPGNTSCNPHEDGKNGAPIMGGGIELINASPTIRNCVLDGCSVHSGNGGNGACDYGDGGWSGWAWGGAVYIDQGTNPLFDKCIFRENQVFPGNGGDGCTSSCSKGGHGGNWGPPDHPRWYYGPYLPYHRYSGYGGAVFCDEGSTPDFVDCNFVGNRVNGSASGISAPCPGWPEQHYRIPRFGGAVYIAANSKPTFTGCSFEDNIGDVESPDVSTIEKYPSDSNAVSIHPYLSYGGAIAMEDGSAPFFENCIFEENIADLGGAITWDDSDPCMDGSEFINNTALIGGALHCVEGAAIITRCHFRLNDANGIIAKGGAIASLGANTAIRDSQFMYNSATGSGGAIYISNKDLDGTDFTGARQTMVKNCLVVGNSAARDGAGLAADGYAEPNVINCTISNNYVTGDDMAFSFGGGVSCYGNAYIKIINSIIWGNTAEDGRQIAIKGDAGHPSEVRVSYSDVQNGAAGVYVETGSHLDWSYYTNFDGISAYDSPAFTDGYYLSQDPCQTETSPCVNAGSDTTFNMEFYRHTTNTNGQIDGYMDVNDIVDVGFHYIVSTTLVGDLDFDGDVDIYDYQIMTVLHWLEEGCHYPDWCQGTDLNQDGIVNLLDQAILSGIFGSSDPNHSSEVNDVTPPMPDPMTWATAPEPNGTESITMTATLAADNSGQIVEYLFQMFDANGEPLAGADANSGWIEERTYTKAGLQPNMTYRFRVKARDPKHNETGWSNEGPATTQDDGTSASDHNPPLPDPMTWSTEPYATDPCAPGSIYMRTVSATDIEGNGVQYRFVCPNDTSLSSNWQDSRVYERTGVGAGTYYFYAIARDMSVNYNTTGASETISVTITGDPAPPLYPPTVLNYWSEGSGCTNVSHHIQIEADTSGLIQYRFVCVSQSAYTSGWITPAETPYTHSKLVGVCSGLKWRVEARLTNDTSQVETTSTFYISYY